MNKYLHTWDNYHEWLNEIYEDDITDDNKENVYVKLVDVKEYLKRIGKDL